METKHYHERYNYKPIPDVNTLPEDDDYIINTNPDPLERYVIKVGKYRNLRNAIIKHLLTFYDRVDYCDADSIKTYLSMRGYKGHQLFTFVFYVEEWHCYQQTEVFQDMISQYLAWGISNYHRNDTGKLFPRLKNTHPLTKYSVLRDESDKI
ncbi:hypothetical protein WAE58_21730 [Pedobacter panaciterrae]|uniref:Uncharacterized protein n=1 Tax=Pedobacter panaciterrae TaxID=363849 RepID=A0ABU8NS44_9SPHI